MKRAVLIAAVAALCVAGSAVAQDRNGVIGSGTRAENSGQVVGSGNVVDQMMGSGGFTMSTQDQWMGNGGRTDGGQIVGSGGYLIGGGLSVRELRLRDGSSLLVVSSDAGMFVIRIEE